jgi:hypothetical protein
MTRTRLMLLGMAAGMLAGCAASSNPSTAGSVASAPPPISQPNVITPSDTDPAGGPQDETATSQSPAPVAAPLQCNQYGAASTINGIPQPRSDQACQQPDGSWPIAEQPGSSVYQPVYWPPVGGVAYNACYNAIYDYQCLYGFPFGFPAGFPVFVDIHHHFHRFVYGAQFHHYGPIGQFGPMDHFAHVGTFHDGFHDGFHGGFAGGFHGQFHGGFSGGGFHH